ncbi:unnamed protein product [Gordionus sp. m RMFG-2023]
MCSPICAKWALLMVILYCTLWSIPFTSLIISHDTGSIGQDRLGLIEIYLFSKIQKWPKIRWIFVSREIFTKYLPFGITVILKLIVIERTKHLFLWNVTKEPEFINHDKNKRNINELNLFLASQLIHNQAIASSESNILNHSVKHNDNNNNPHLSQVYSSSQGNIIHGDTCSDHAILSTNRVLEEKAIRKKLETRKNFKLLFILLIEFLILLLPISIDNMLYILNLQSVKGIDINVWYSLYLLESMYVVVTFYVNIIFNKCYRENFKLAFKDKTFNYIRSNRISNIM